MLDNIGLDRQAEDPYMAQEQEDLMAFLERRRESLRQLVRSAKTELERYEKELSNTEAALGVVQQASSVSPATGEMPRLTMKQAAMKVLTPLAPQGLSALSILERLRVDFGMDYPRESLSPQLSRLKAEGRLRLEGGIWFSTEKENGSGTEAPEPP